MADNIEDYAIVTVDTGDRQSRFIDIKVDRKLRIKKIILGLYSALGQNTNNVHGFYVKAKNSGQLLGQNDTLEAFNIYDGEILKIL